MRIKLITKNTSKDKELLDSNKYSIVDKGATHILIDCSDNNIIGKENDTLKPINPIEVLYVESYGNDVFCHTVNGKYKIDARLFEYIEKYESLGFIQIGKSYVVNINYIVSIYPLINMRYIVMLTNSTELVVTRTYLKKFKERIKGGNHGIR